MKILLIMPKFVNYPETIQMGLRNLGHDVKWVDDRPSNDPFTKALVRVNKEVLSRPIDRYFESVRHDAEEAQYDLVLVVSGQSLSFGKEHLLRLRCVIPNARFVLYQWDAVENYPHVLSVLDCFDEAYTFDERDSRSYRMEFLPLFYHPGYQAIGRRSKAKIEADYDVAFIGTAHPKKYGFVQEVVEQCEGLLDRKYIYHFLPSRLLYARHKLLSEDYRRAAYSQFHFDALTPEETEEVVSRSWCMLDSPQDGQRGLTMRTMECLGARRKIITTNEEIMGYDFYRKENVYVYRGRMDRKDPFFSSEYVDLPEDIYEKYSLRSWLETVVGRGGER